jgi:hypothetical protein
MEKLKLKLRYKTFEIPGFPDYCLHIYGDNDFRIWSKPRVDALRHKRGNYYLTNSLNEKGYLRVTLSKDGKPNTVFIHQIVASILVENPENKPTVDHIDRDKSNNRPANLRWATNQEQNNNRGLYSNNTSGVKGVTWDKNRNKWRVKLRENGKFKYFGCFKDKKEAEIMRNLEYRRIHGLSN